MELAIETRARRDGETNGAVREIIKLGRKFGQNDDWIVAYLETELNMTPREALSRLQNYDQPDKHI